MTRVHFLGSDEPIHEGQTIKVACGEEVPNIVYVYLCDTAYSNVPLDCELFKNSCRKCLGRVITGRRRYAVANGQEAMLEETA